MVLSSNRSGVLGKYLVALSESVKAADEAQNNNPNPPETSGKRKRLHILYLLNDIFHHTKYHSQGGPGAFVTFSSALQPHLVELLGFAASYDRDKNPKHHGRLDQLLDVWADCGYYSAEYVGKLREAVKNSASLDEIKASVGLLNGAGELQPKGAQRDVPYVMPAAHGDPSSPFYDLPAGNFVPHIIPDSATPIRPENVKPLQFLAGPADQKLVTAVKKFLKDVDRIYGSGDFDRDDNAVVDIDELGQAVVRHEKTGDILEGDTYYGWSRDFCVQMKKRRGKDSGRSQSHSRDDRFSRRGYSDSSSSDNGRRGGLSSRDRSGSRDRRRRFSSSRSRSPSRSGHRSKRSRSDLRSRSGSYSPRPPSPPRSFPQPHQTSHQGYPTPYGTSPAPPYPYNNVPQLQPQSIGSGVPIPPPPSHYNGPWTQPPPFPLGGNYPVPPGMPGFALPGPPPGQYGPPPGPGQMPPGSYPHNPPWGQGPPTGGGRGWK